MLGFFILHYLQEMVAEINLEDDAPIVEVNLEGNEENEAAPEISQTVTEEEPVAEEEPVTE